jgi:hypothetical protein
MISEADFLSALEILGPLLLCELIKDFVGCNRKQFPMTFHLDGDYVSDGAAENVVLARRYKARHLVATVVFHE